jgi:hypothetical protein
MKYIQIINGVLQEPARLKKVYNKIHGFNNLSDADLSGFGFYLYNPPVFDEQIQEIITTFENGSLVYEIQDIVFVLEDVYNKRLDKLIELTDRFHTILIELSAEGLMSGKPPKHKDIYDSFILWKNTIWEDLDTFKTNNDSQGLVKYVFDMTDYNLLKEEIKTKKNKTK